MPSASQEIKAIELIAPRKFHRIFTVPATDKHGPLKVTYSIAGVDVDEGEDVPTIFFCGGMFGTRWLAPWLDWISKTEGVRMIFLDRLVGRFQVGSVTLSNFLSCLLFILPRRFRMEVRCGWFACVTMQTILLCDEAFWSFFLLLRSANHLSNLTKILQTWFRRLNTSRSLRTTCSLPRSRSSPP
jgi:hypothetical protein